MVRSLEMGMARKRASPSLRVFDGGGLTGPRQGGVRKRCPAAPEAQQQSLEVHHMRTINKFGEVVYRVEFARSSQAHSFAKMIAANPTRFSILGLDQVGDVWVLRY